MNESQNQSERWDRIYVYSLPQGAEDGGYLLEFIIAGDNRLEKRELKSVPPLLTIFCRRVPLFIKMTGSITRF